jgi:FKBP-type peptidyl-prolyl cis-trans isomerase 2
MLHFILLSAIGIALLVGQGLVTNFVQAFSGLVKINNDAVRDGAKVTVRYHITLRDNPPMTYSATEEFVQGQHSIPRAFEQRMAGMQPGQAKTFPLSAEEGFGPYDETKTQTIPTADLPLNAREGDIVDDDAGRTAKIMRIFPETTTLDLNHPLAGQPLMVTVLIVGIENRDDVDNSSVTGKGDRSGHIMVDPGTGWLHLGDVQRISM